MSNWWIIAHKEAAQTLNSRSAVVTMLISTALVVGSLLLMTDDYQQRKHSYDRRDTVGQTRAGKRPKLTAHPSHLSVLAKGLEAHAGRLLLITWSQPRRQPGAAVLDRGDQNPLFSLFRAPDFTHIVTFVFSLLALILAYDAVGGERQRGTLRLILAQPVSRAAFLTGKLAGLALSLLLLLGLSWLTMLALLVLAGPPNLGTQDWLRIGGILLLSILYLTLFLNLGLWVSVLVARPAAALLVLLCIWTVWVIGLPNLAIPLGRWLQPFPPVEQIEAQKSQLRQADFASYLDYANACWAIDDRYIAQVDAQINTTLNLSRLSPMAAYTYAATALAGTGIQDVQGFRNAVVRWDRNQRRSGYNWQGQIPFTHQARTLQHSWNTALPDLAILALWNLFFLSAAFTLFVRRDLI